MVHPYKIRLLVGGLIFGVLLSFTTTSYAGNDVLGEIELVDATKVEKTSGVWVDGQYVGYLKELKGVEEGFVAARGARDRGAARRIHGFLPKSHGSTGRKTSHPSSDGEGSADADSDDNCRNQTFGCPG